jgi:hypothetical protein
MLLSGVAWGSLLGSVAGSTVPRHAEGLRFSSRVPSGWTGSNSSVASLPANLRMTLEPPGWSVMKLVTWFDFGFSLLAMV